MAYDMSVLGSESASSLIVTASFADHDAVPPRDVLAPIKKFADLGAHGGLSGPGFNPAEAQVAIVAADLSPDGLARWRLSAERVAPEAIDMLLGSVAFIDAKIARLRSVAVEAPRALTQSRDRPTPGYYRPTPFSLVDDRAFQSRGFQIAVHFAGMQPQDVLDRTELACGAWFSAANVGCFSSRSVPADMSHVFLGEPETGDDVLVLAVDEAFVSEPDATAALVNVLQWVHWHIAPLVHVELYE